MKFEQKLAMYAVMLVLFAPAAQAGPETFGMVDGTYSQPHTVSTAQGDVSATDLLTLQHAKDGYRFSLIVKHDYGYECRLDGYGQMSDATDGINITYVQPEDEVKGKRCEFAFHITATKITVNDPRFTCSQFCGIGATLHGAQFARDTRQGL